MFEPATELKVIARGGEYYLGKANGVDHTIVLLGKISLEPLSEAEDLINISQAGALGSPEYVQRVVKFDDGSEIRRRPINSVYVFPDGTTTKIDHHTANQLIHSNDGDGELLRRWREAATK